MSLRRDDKWALRDCCAPYLLNQHRPAVIARNFGPVRHAPTAKILQENDVDEALARELVPAIKGLEHLPVVIEGGDRRPDALRLLLQPVFKSILVDKVNSLGGLPAISAELMAPIEMPAIQSGCRSASANA